MPKAAYAMHPGVCDRCERVYPMGTLLVLWHRQWVHETCVPGGDDE